MERCMDDCEISDRSYSGCELPGRCWELSSGPRREQPVLIATLAPRHTHVLSSHQLLYLVHVLSDFYNLFILHVHKINGAEIMTF